MVGRLDGLGRRRTRDRCANSRRSAARSMMPRPCSGSIIEHSSAVSKSQYSIKHGRSQTAGAIALRQLQWKHAKRPDASGVAMTIHMSTHRLGEHDKALHLNLTVQDVDEI